MQVSLASFQRDVVDLRLRARGQRRDHFDAEPFQRADKQWRQLHRSDHQLGGSDHQFAHLWEMEEVAVGGLPVSHGACVGIGCLSMLAAYEWLLRQDLSRIAPAAR